MNEVTLVVPAGATDAARPSGGNRYDRELAASLAEGGWRVSTATVGDEVDGLLLVDGLVLPAFADRDVVPLLHIAPDAASLEIVRRASAVVTTSGWTRERVLELAPELDGRIVVARPGVASPRALVTTSVAGTRIRCLAALLSHKGQHLLVAALARVADLDWTCELVGATDLDPEFVLQVRRLADGLGIGDRVVLTGPQSADSIDGLYDGADLVVVPSLEESYGMVIAEAIACGVPVIVADTGGVRESLVGGAGLLVPRANPDALAAALRRWLTDASVRARLTAGARAAERRDWSETARDVAAALNVGAPDPVLPSRRG